MKKNIEWNDALIAGLTPGQKRIQKRIDGTCGLYIFVEPSGRKSWYCRYSSPYGTGSALLGVFAPGQQDHLSMMAAKSRAINVITAVKGGKPASVANITFREVAEKWLEQYIQNSRTTTAEAVKNRFKLYVEKSSFYEKNIENVTRAELREVIQGLITKPQTAKRVYSIYNLIFKYAVGLGYMNTQNPMPESKYLLPQIHEQNRAAVTNSPELFGDIVLKLKTQYNTGDNCAGLLLFLAYCFTRPIEARMLQWRHVWNKENVIKLNASDTKTSAPLMIPITEQVRALIERQREKRITPVVANEYIFFAPRRGPKYPVCDASPGQKLRQLGIPQDEQSAHGFRSCASTFLREYLDMPDGLIELQLNHKIGNGVSRSYNKSTKIQQRREMLQKWNDWVDLQAEEALNRLSKR